MLDPQTAAEPSAALLSSQKCPLGSTALRGYEKPLEFGMRTVVYGPVAATVAEGAARAARTTVSPSRVSSLVRMTLETALGPKTCSAYADAAAAAAGWATPIIASRVTSPVSSSSVIPSVPSGRRGITR